MGAHAFQGLEGPTVWQMICEYSTFAPHLSYCVCADDRASHITPCILVAQTTPHACNHSLLSILVTPPIKVNKKVEFEDPSIKLTI